MIARRQSPVTVIALCLIALCLLAFDGVMSQSGEPKQIEAASPRTSEQTRNAVDRALEFLDKDAVKWREEKKCSTCHHGAMTVWAMTEAKSQGYPIAGDKLADVTKWTMERLKDIDKPRDTRPG